MNAEDHRTAIRKMAEENRRQRVKEQGGPTTVTAFNQASGDPAPITADDDWQKYDRAKGAEMRKANKQNGKPSGMVGPTPDADDNNERDAY